MLTTQNTNHLANYFSTSKKVINLPAEKHAWWNGIRDQYLSEKFFLTMYEGDENSTWKTHLQFKKSLNPYTRSDLLHFISPPKFDSVNDYLRYSFIADFELHKNYWKKMEKSCEITQLYIPISDILKFSRNELENQIHIQVLKTRYFPFIDLLKDLHAFHFHHRVERKMSVDGIYYFFKHFITFLNRIRESEAELFDIIKKDVLVTNMTVELKKMLPSEQLVYICWSALQELFLDNEPQVSSLHLSNLLPEVKHFWTQFGPSLRMFFYADFKKDNSLKKKLNIGFHSKVVDKVVLQKAFALVVKADTRYLRAQKIINSKEEKYQNYDELKPFLIKQVSFFKKLKSLVSSTNKQIENLQKITYNPQIDIRLGPKSTLLFPKNNFSWQSLSKEDLKTLDAAIETIGDERKEILNEEVDATWSKHLQNILNQLYAPFIIWERNKIRKYQVDLIPHWDLMDDKYLEVIWRERRERNKLEKAELARLEKITIELHTKKHLNELAILFQASLPFKYKYIQKEWEEKYTAYKLKLERQFNQRVKRMIEFGIIKSKNEYTYDKEIWFDEILQIEEEVKPYIPYVRQAFLAAMPIKQVVEFDPYRNNHFGVEFDPDTLNDQNKWMRGEIMKAYRYKTERGEIVQINSFALDYSGSMHHERMRNLFKIMYLLIRGLEGRKTYDAFNFFGTHFKVAADFEKKYTNQSVLYKILINISGIENGAVVYHGYGGTNMSGGIINSYKRSRIFEAELKKENPETDFLSSIFVITDGKPTVGILDLDILHAEVDKLRKEGNTAIKGIFIKGEEEENEIDFMTQIFGEGEFVESSDFGHAVNQFIQIMVMTYKKQRQELKMQKKKLKYQKK